MPAGQLVQDDAPAAEYLPARHGEQPVRLVPVPDTDPAKPAAQIVHAEALVSTALTAEVMPVGQLVQDAAPAAEYVPAEHAVHDEAPSAENVPAEQLEQVAELTDAEYVPAKHFVQPVAAVPLPETAPA